ncbi:hypothetical protein Gorai_005912 [Gossypium raimondii]|uniref:Uncharacterized protein n=1 Tax=Gossypium raimondii TaxID=29730 RepID=A0A7J8QDR7_GOSRA|nr:hypothetical protein [Gossypium raimondii]
MEIFDNLSKPSIETCLK